MILRTKQQKTLVLVVLLLGLGLIIQVLKPKLTEKKSSQDYSPQQVFKLCESESQPSEKFDCYEQIFTIDIKENGAKHTLNLLDQIQRLGGYAKANCHPLTHKIGNIAYHVYGSVLAASPQYLPVCYSGYYHGLLEEYLSQTPDYDIAVLQACGPATGKVYWDWFQCTHGLGHGIMQYREDDVLQSLKDCDLLEPGSSAREICYAGVFMENITTDEKTGHPSKFIKAEDPIYPCDIVESKYKSSCYFLSSSMILRLNKYDFVDAFKTCDIKAEKDYVWLCYQSMGRDVSGSTLRNKQKVVDLCMLGSSEFRGDCFFGAVRDFINEKGEFDGALELCKAIPDAYQERCFTAIDLDLSFYRKGQDYLAVCAKMPEKFQAACIPRAN